MRAMGVRGTLAGAGLIAAVLTSGCAPGGATPDGKHVFFETNKPLVGADNDAARDVYERAGGTTTLISRGPFDDPADPAAQFDATSSDGERVFFTTAERLVEEDDDDSHRDIYMRFGNQTKLISNGPIVTNPLNDAEFEEASSDGRSVVFSTNEKLTGQDLDDQQPSVYHRRGSRTRLAAPAFVDVESNFLDLLDGGDLVVFETNTTIFGEDGDGGNFDIYTWRDGEFELISQGPDENYALEAEPAYEGASTDGGRIFFQTTAALHEDDTDSDNSDVYQRRGQRTTLVAGGGDGEFNISAAAVSRSGARVALETNGALTGQDDDANHRDIYVAAAGETKLVSRGPVADDQAHDAFFEGAPSSLGAVVFETEEQLVGADDDAAFDIYVRRGNATEIVSQGPEGGNADLSADFADISADGKIVFFETSEALTSIDDDSTVDVYRRAVGRTTLISRGPGDAGNEGFNAGLLFASTDGARAFFFTGEKLVPADDQPSGACDDDDDPACSGYERFKNKTKLFSRGN